MVRLVWHHVWVPGVDPAQAQHKSLALICMADYCMDTNEYPLLGLATASHEAKAVWLHSQPVKCMYV